MKKWQLCLGMISLSALCLAGCGNSVTIKGRSEQDNEVTEKTKKSEKKTEKNTEKNKKDTDEAETTKEEETTVPDISGKGGKDDTLLEDLPEKTNYYDSEGKQRYCKKYVYYENGLKCSETLYRNEYYDNVETGEEETYISALYTLLFFYDEEGEVLEANLDSVTIPDSYHPEDGGFVLSTDYRQDGTTDETIIFPFEEDIDQEKFGVDPKQTKEEFGDPFVIDKASTVKWAEKYLSDGFEEEPISDWTTCAFAYINDDDVPELWVNGNYGYAGARLYTTDKKGNNGDCLECYWGMVYFKEGNETFWVTEGHTGIYSDTFYRIKNGTFDLQEKGEFSYEFTSDSAQEPVSSYYWNDSEVSEEEYAERLESSLPAKDCDTMEDFNLFTYEQAEKLLTYIVSNKD